MMTDRIMTRVRALKGLSLFARDCSGSTAIEYALIASGISIAILVAVTNIGTAVLGMITQLLGIY